MLNVREKKMRKSLGAKLLTTITLFSCLVPIRPLQIPNLQNPAPFSPNPLSANAQTTISGSNFIEQPVGEELFVPNELLVKIRVEAASRVTSDSSQQGRFNTATLDALALKFPIRSITPVFGESDQGDPLTTQYGFSRIMKLTLGPKVHLLNALTAFRADPNIEYAEPNYTVRMLFTPNDPSFSNQWGLENAKDKDIDASQAWSITKGKATVLIAIVDTGVLYTHPDLQGSRMRTDIDKDFSNNDDDAIDDNGHGTHVAGIIAANTDNSEGIAGVCPGCSILPIKVLDSSLQGNAETVSKGIKYAADQHADIISLSLGMTPKCGCSKTIAQALNYAFVKGSLLIAASGNDGTSSLSYPSSSSRVMSIGATNKKDQKTSWSNYGGGLDLVAPGDTILSTWLSDSYADKSGTSMSTPFVSGVAGLILSQNSSRSNVRVWWILQHSTDPLNGQKGWNSKVGFGRLNAYKALKYKGAGSVTAPIDTCNKEPQSGCGGCSTNVILNQIANADVDRQDLYSFRDQVMLKTDRGKLWVDIFYKHNDELGAILLKNNILLNQMVKIYRELKPAMLYVLSSGQGKPVVLTSSHIRSLSNLKNTLILTASPGMVSDINQEWDYMGLERFAGKDVYSIWREITK